LPHRKDRPEHRFPRVENAGTRCDLRAAAANEAASLLPSQSRGAAARADAAAGSSLALQAIVKPEERTRLACWRRQPRRHELFVQEPCSLHWLRRSHRFDVHRNQRLTSIFIRANSECHIPRRRGQLILCAVKINRAPMAIALAQTKEQVLFVHHARRRNRLNFTRKEQRLRISVSKRL